MNEQAKWSGAGTRLISEADIEREFASLGGDDFELRVALANAPRRKKRRMRGASKLLNVAKLVGIKSGTRVDLRTRLANGTVRYKHQDKPILGTLDRVESVTERGQEWLYWHFTADRAHEVPCGYSGIVAGSEPVFLLQISTDGSVKP